jgi:hypothetical protein
MSRMNEYNRLAPVQLGEDRIEFLIAQIAVVHTGKKSDTVKAQNVERVGDLLQRAVDVRHWQKRKSAEARRVFGDPPSLELIADSRDFTQSVEVFQKHAWSERRDRGLNVPTVHRAQLRLSVR